MIFLFSISDTFALFFIDYRKYLVRVITLNVGSVRRGGTKGWCCCVSLFSFHLNFLDFSDQKKPRATTFSIHSRLFLNIMVPNRYHLSGWEAQAYYLTSLELVGVIFCLDFSFLITPLIN